MCGGHYDSHSPLLSFLSQYDYSGGTVERTELYHLSALCLHAVSLYSETSMRTTTAKHGVIKNERAWDIRELEGLAKERTWMGGGGENANDQEQGCHRQEKPPTLPKKGPGAAPVCISSKTV